MTAYSLDRRGFLGLVSGLALAGPPLHAARPQTAEAAETADRSPRFLQPDPKGFPDLFLWTDTCNVYVLRDGDAALLIDLGDGSVLDHLAEIGVRRVEWVLFTHHHREQCQGYPRLRGRGAKVAGPEAERALFERPADFRRMAVRLGDPFTIHGSSYVRPPLQPIPLDRALGKVDTFTWRGTELRCTDTRGNSPGALSYLTQRDGRWVAFSGDVMLEDARMHTWFDTEWDYGFAAGIYALTASASLVASFRPLWLFPSHGRPVRDPGPQLREYQLKLRRLGRLLVRGYEVNTFGGATQDTLSQPTEVPYLWQVSPHLYKLKGPDFWPNFHLLLAESGRALVVDCGLVDEAMLQQTLEGARRHRGLKGIDAVVVTHMHGDHFLQVPYLREKWGARAWALDRMAPVCEHPEWFDYAAPIQAYGSGLDGLRFDRLFRSGESFDWEGYRLTVDWMPGQTEFALCLHGEIDGRRVAFTGDNLFGDPSDPHQDGHEAVVAHNSAVLEEGYLQAAEYLTKLQPDLLLGGHSFVMDRPAGMIERYRQWAHAMRDAFRALSPYEDYRYGWDPFWVRAEPYRVSLRPGGEASVAVHVRGFGAGHRRHRIEVHAPEGLAVEPAVLEGRLAGEERTLHTLRLRAAAEARPGVYLVAFDVTRDSHRHGEWFDLIVAVQP